MGWISTEDSLPEEGKYVLGKTRDGRTWVVTIGKGISKQQRENMKAGLEVDPDVTGWCLSEGITTYKRSESYRSCDEEGNNKVPYNWTTHGPQSLFGQDIIKWMDIPE